MIQDLSACQMMKMLQKMVNLYMFNFFIYFACVNLCGLHFAPMLLLLSIFLCISNF
uniref:Uncharacterized protein n=1 Tax=Rhizophora mucronata TaxID=61149 RepID=A0A2P2MEH1_RHIMU